MSVDEGRKTDSDQLIQHRFLEFRPPWTESYLHHGRSSLRAEAVCLGRHDPAPGKNTKGQQRVTWTSGHQTLSLKPCMHYSAYLGVQLVSMPVHGDQFCLGVLAVVLDIG